MRLSVPPAVVSGVNRGGKLGDEALSGRFPKTHAALCSRHGLAKTSASPGRPVAADPADHFAACRALGKVLALAVSWSTACFQ